MTTSARTRLRIWTAPVIIAVGTLISLVAALVADGVWDGLAALLMSVMTLYVLVQGVRSHERRAR